MKSSQSRYIHMALRRPNLPSKGTITEAPNQYLVTTGIELNQSRRSVIDSEKNEIIEGSFVESSVRPKVSTWQTLFLFKTVRTLKKKISA